APSEVARGGREGSRTRSDHAGLSEGSAAGWIEGWRRAPAARRRPMLERELHRLAARILGIDGAGRIPVDQPLHEMGLDSLMAVELRNAISRAVERPLAATLLFNHPTLESLTDHLLELEFGAASEAEARKSEDGGPAVSPTSGMDVLEALERLSDDEVEALFARGN